VYANDLDDVNNRFWYGFAENASRTVVWTGPTPGQVTDEAFNLCQGIPRTTIQQTVGFFIFDVGDSENFIQPLGGLA
jgi:hypothetical protein